MRKKGGQPGNSNARREHPRLAVSFSGTRLDLLYERLAQRGKDSPTGEQVKALIYELVDAELRKEPK
jgi:hypothetical protein